MKRKKRKNNLRNIAFGNLVGKSSIYLSVLLMRHSIFQLREYFHSPSLKSLILKEQKCCKWANNLIKSSFHYPSFLHKIHPNQFFNKVEKADE